MKIIIAGATGAIGQPLINFLVDEGHEVYGITQSHERAHILKDKGAKPLVLNVLDQPAVFSAFADIQPEVVVDMLTHLPKEYTPESMRDAAELDAKIRFEGGANLLAAAEKFDTKRYILQSRAFWYEPGEGLADENASFAFHGTPGIVAGTRLQKEIENRLQQSSIESVILRFGFFYGPGTWFNPHANMEDQVRSQQFPLVGQGQGVWTFIHIEDAAQAVELAINCPPGIYNIVDDDPLPLKEWLTAFAHYVGVAEIGRMTEEEALKLKGSDFVYYATKLRGASNQKAKKILHFHPRKLEWLKSFKPSAVIY